MAGTDTVEVAEAVEVARVKAAAGNRVEAAEVASVRGAAGAAMGEAAGVAMVKAAAGIIGKAAARSLLSRTAAIAITIATVTITAAPMLSSSRREAITMIAIAIVRSWL